MKLYVGCVAAVGRGGVLWCTSAHPVAPTLLYQIEIDCRHHWAARRARSLSSPRDAECKKTSSRSKACATSTAAAVVWSPPARRAGPGALLRWAARARRRRSGRPEPGAMRPKTRFSFGKTAFSRFHDRHARLSESMVAASLPSGYGPGVWGVRPGGAASVKGATNGREGAFG